MRRGPWNRPASREDLKWFYAGYRMGAFGDEIEEGLAPDEFAEVIEARAGMVDQVFSLFAPGHREGQPSGLVTAAIDSQANIHVHAIWMPWASPRNKLEAALQFVRDIGRDANVLIHAPFETKGFFERLCNYGVLEKVGHVKRYFAAEGPVFNKGRAVLFQSRVV